MKPFADFSKEFEAFWLQFKNDSCESVSPYKDIVLTAIINWELSNKRGINFTMANTDDHQKAPATDSEEDGPDDCSTSDIP